VLDPHDLGGHEIDMTVTWDDVEPWRLRKVEFPEVDKT
jgi:hypothetical protein